MTTGQQPSVKLYGATNTEEHPKHDDHEQEHAHDNAHELEHLKNLHHHREHDPAGYPKETSIWHALPTWVLLVLEYLIGLGVAESLAFAVAVFWPVAAIYHYEVSKGHKVLQHILALIVFIIALIVSPIVFLVLGLVALVLWVIWLVKDIQAVVGDHADHPRPKITSPYFTGLYTYAN